jgi:hypothetical protein
MITPRMANSIARSIRRRVDRCELSLSDLNVITEAATGAYAVTAAAACYAGAQVWALNVNSSHGSAMEARRDVMSLASALGTRAGVQFVEDKSALPFEIADIVTNSGLLRPIEFTDISRLQGHATIGLMYEAWEARATDIDYAAAAARGINIIGVDEHHPACDAFDFVGDLALYGLRQQQWPVRDTRVVVFSDNLFAEPVARALEACGAIVTVTSVPTDTSITADVAVVATTPIASVAGRIDAKDLSNAIIATESYGCVQLWGDLDRTILEDAGIAIVPSDEPPRGHQGISMTAAGFEAVVRLQVGGLAAVQHRSVPHDSSFFGLAQLLQPLDRTLHDS